MLVLDAGMRPLQDRLGSARQQFTARDPVETPDRTKTRPLHSVSGGGRVSRIACIGSRTVPPPILAWIEGAGAELVRAGHTIVSGNAAGADQAWARGGNSVDPRKVELCLPWADFEEHAVHPHNVVRVLDDVPVEDRQKYLDVIRTHNSGQHPNPAVVKLFARNAMIIIGPLHPGSQVHWNRVSRVLAYGVERGGTRRCCKIASRYGVTIFDVENPAVREGFDWATVNGPVFP